MKEYLRLLQYARPIRWAALRYFFASLFHSIFGVLNLTMLIPLLQVLFGTVEEEKIAAIKAKGLPQFDWTLDFFIDYFQFHFYQIIEEQGPLRALQFVCLAVLVSVFLSNFFTYMRSLQSEAIRARTTKNVRSDVFKKITRLHVGYFSNQKKGDLLARSTTDVNEVEMSIANSFTLVLREPVLIAVYFIALFKMSPEMTLFALTVVPLLGASLATLIRRVKRKADRVQIYQGIPPGRRRENDYSSQSTV